MLADASNTGDEKTALSSQKDGSAVLPGVLEWKHKSQGFGEFVIDTSMYLFGHQSTWNPNTPIRFLLYVSDLYSNITKDQNLYSDALVHLPAPRMTLPVEQLKEKCRDYDIPLTCKRS